MIGVGVLVAVVLLFLILGTVFCLGKGSFLISGYNTASKEEQEKYDEKKLCRVMGIYSYVIGIAFSFLTVLAYQVEVGKREEQTLAPVAIGITIALLIGTGLVIYICNTRCKKTS